MKKIADFENDDILQTYMKHIKCIPLLSAEEEVALSALIQEGDEAAKKRLVESNLRLVIKICYAYRVQDVPLMDMIQEGNLGLMHACDKFDGTKNIRFSTYAALWIKQAVTRFLESKRRAIHIPVQKEELIRKIGVAEANLKQILERNPTIAELAEEVHCDQAEIIQISGVTSNVVSFEGEINDESGHTYEEIFEDAKQINPEDEYLKNTSSRETRRFLKRHLNSREHNVIMQRFRFQQTGYHTFKKIGEQMGISAEAVRQIEKKALRKISQSRDELADCVYA
ncbi:MAG: hypothetical protein Ta2B_28480 [Termitinemataceae bacterium]|nr:MAG: hypothetical protein Ta2B_28480 [Termitinemataceae bacterium]